jgi:hypothetical protein
VLSRIAIWGIAGGMPIGDAHAGRHTRGRVEEVSDLTSGMAAEAIHGDNRLGQDVQRNEGVEMSWGKIVRRAAVLAGAGAALAAPAVQANAVLMCGWAGCELFILGPHTPNPRSSPHMGFKIKPSRVKAGKTLVATAHGFLAGEYVTIWDYTGRHWSHSSELNGGNATRRGTLTFDRETTWPETAAGKHKICLQGERSHRVACATYTVLSGGPTTGPGFQEPGSSSSGSGSSSSGTSGWTPPTTGPGYQPPPSG